MKKKAEEDLSMFEDAKQYICILLPHTLNSWPNIVKKMTTNQPKFVQFINKNQIQKYAIDQGFHDNEKQVNDDQMAQAFKQYLQEENNNQKREKKIQQEQAAKAQASKKETKKQEQVEVKAEEKQYQKLFDQLFILDDYPQTFDELKFLSINQIKIDIILRVQENLDVFNQEQEQQSMEMDNSQDIEEIEKPQIDFSNNQCIENLRQYQTKSQRYDIMRDVYIQDINYDESEDFQDLIYEDISHFSFEKENYYQWIKSKPQISLQKKQIQYPTQQEELQIEQSLEREKQLDLENEERQKLLQKKKRTEQDNIDDEHYNQEKNKEQEIRNQLNSQIQKIIENSQKYQFATFKKQIENIKDENLTVGIVLEALLDEFKNEKNPDEDTNESEQESNFILEYIKQLKIQMNDNNKVLINKQEEKQIDYQVMLLNNCDTQSIKAQNCRLKSGELGIDREQLILDQIKYPGINRDSMPQYPQISCFLQNINHCENLSFQKNFLECKVLNHIDNFQKICHQKLNIKYDFTNRKYVETLNENMLKSKIYNSLINEKQIYTQYNLFEDSLYLIIADKMVQGRVRIQKTQMPWKVLPNLEYYIKQFKNSNQQQFYDFDYKYLGNINLKQKNIMPYNDGIIKFQTQTIGQIKNTLFRVIKDNVTFKVDKKTQQFNSIFKNGTRIFVEIVNDNLYTTFTLKNGLMVMILPNGEIQQSYQFSNQKLDEQKRHVLGKGSVIKHMNDGKIVILFANGNVATKEVNSDKYITVNNKGKQSIQGEVELENIPCAKKRDWYNTKAYTLQREDNVQIIQYPNGNQYTLHSDGTKIVSYANGQIILEHAEYATITIDKKENYKKIKFFDQTLAKFTQENIEIELKDGSKLDIQNDGNAQLSFKDETKYQIDIKQGIISHIDQQENNFNISEKKQSCKVVSTFKIQSELNEQCESADSSENEFLFDFLKDQTIEIDEFYQPQLIVIKDDQAYEYLSKKQINEFLNSKNLQTFQKNEYQEHILLKKLPKFQEFNDFQNEIQDCVDEKKPNQENQQIITLIRNIKEFPNIDYDEFQQQKKKFEQWKNQNLKGLIEWGYKQRSNTQRKDEKILALKILELRKIQFEEESYNDFFNSIQFKNMIEQFKQDYIQVQQKLNEKTKIKKDDVTKSTLDTKLLMSFSGIEKKYKSYKFKSQLSVEIQKVATLQFQQSYFKTSVGIQALYQMGPQSAPNKVKKQKEVEQKESIKETSQEEIDQMREEERLKRLSTIKKSDQQKKKSILHRPSVFQLQDNEQIQIDNIKRIQAEQHCSLKKKEFNLYGNKRDYTLKVPSILRSNPKYKINERYIVQDSNWENRVKISSMNKRLDFLSQSIQLKRKQGAHQTLNDLQDKKHNVSTIIERENIGIISDLHDEHKKNILILPARASFGLVQQGKIYQMKLAIKNEDIMIQRLCVKPPNTKYVKAFQSELGPIALGLIREVIVQIDAHKEILGVFEDKFEIITKQQIFTIPVKAKIITQEEFEALDQEYSIIKQKRLLKKGVQEITKELADKTQTNQDNNSSSNNNLPKIKNLEKNESLEAPNLENIVNQIEN